MKKQTAGAATHTPGPWELSPRRDREGAFRVIRDGYAVAIVTLRGSSPASPQYHEQDANARLIAAAPDLLDVLRVTAGNIRSLGPAGALANVYTPYEVWLAVVEAAIAKAEGWA